MSKFIALAYKFLQSRPKMDETPNLPGMTPPTPGNKDSSKFNTTLEVSSKLGYHLNDPKIQKDLFPILHCLIFKD